MSNSRTLLRVSLGRTLIVDSVKQSTLALLCALSVTLFLSACGPAGSSTSVTPQSSSRSSNPSTGAAIAGISAPPGSSDRPLAPGQNGTQYLPNGLPAFQPARGINAEMLFAEKISDSDERFRRLENAVMDLRREFDSVSPAIVRLAAVEGDMQDLIGQLQTLVNNGPSDVNMDLDAAPVAGVTADSLPPRPFPEAPPPEVTQEYQDAPPVPAETPVEEPEKPPEPTAPTPVTPEAELEKQAANNALPPPAPPASGDPAPLQPKAAEGRAMPPPEFKPAITTPLPAPTPAPAPAPQVETKVETPAPAPTTSVTPQPGKTTVTSVRTGEQPGGVTRIVLDLTGSSSHHSDLDNEEHLLLVEMPEAGWSAAPKGTFAKAPLLTSWTTEPINDGKGTRLILQLSKSVRITGEQSLDDPDRIVLDLKESP